MEDNKISEAARILSNKRKRVNKVCLTCGVKFLGYKKSKYCSLACNQKEYHRRKNIKKRGV